MSLALSRSSETSTRPAPLSQPAVLNDSSNESRSSSLGLESDSAVFHGAKFENCNVNLQIVHGPVEHMAPTATQPLRKRRVIISDDEDD